MPTEQRKLADEVEAALKSLETYGNGGKRSALLPLDRAVERSCSGEPNRDLLEQRLRELLQREVSAPAKQYICGKLILIGSAASVPALASLLADAKVAADARSALESMPDDAAAKALLEKLPKLTGPQRAGVLSSLGVRRYKPAVRALQVDLKHPDPLVQKAARRALSEIKGQAQ